MPSSGRITNLNYLKDASANNHLFIKEMIEIFLKQTPMYIAELKESSENRSWSDFRKVIHKLKPTITMMGMKRGDGLVKEMEELVKKETNLNDVPLLLLSLEDLCKEAYQELEEELANPS